MKLLRKMGDDAQDSESAFAQRLEAIASRSKVGTALYDSKDDEPSSED